MNPPQQDDGPPGHVVDFASVADAVPRIEPHSRYGNPPSYTVFGKTYHVMDSSLGHVERGIASWYGRKFHGRRTSSGEPYDMLAMTAAHKSLPLPSYVRVTRLDNGRSMVVRVNDRGPFHEGRIIDLSYAAAVKLGMQHRGTAHVEIRAIDPRTPRPALRVAEQDGVTERTEAVTIAAESSAADDIEQQAVAATEVSTANLLPSLADIPQPVHHQQTAALAELTDYGTAPEDAHHPPAPHAEVYLQLGAFSQRNNAERLQAQLKDLADSFVIRKDSTRQPPIYRLRVGPLDDVEAANALAPRLLPHLSRLGISKPRIVID